MDAQGAHSTVRERVVPPCLSLLPRQVHGDTGKKQECRRKLVYSCPWIPAASLMGNSSKGLEPPRTKQGSNAMCHNRNSNSGASIFPLFAMSWIYPRLSLISVCDPALFPAITGNAVFIRACNVPWLKFGLWEERPKHWSSSHSSGVSG